MRKYIIGFIVGVMLMASTSAFAAIGSKVEASFASFTFLVNGQEKTLDADPLTYQGSTYLPVRVVANILGYDVVYKADSRVIELNKDEPAQQIPLTPVKPVEPIESAPTDGEKTQESKGGGTVTTPTDTISEPVAEPKPAEPVVDNTAACKAIRDDYSVKIGMLAYQGLKQGPYLLQVHLLEYERDQTLSKAGCN